MEVDSTFLDPIKEFHPILRVVEMPPEELAAMLPMRINLFSFVRHPYCESYGFPIDAPNVSGKELIRIHTSLSKQIAAHGADTATVRSQSILTKTHKVMYNSFAPLGSLQEYCLQSEGAKEPVVVYEDRIVPLAQVEQHINALAIYCNTLYHDPKDGKGPLLNRMPDGYTINATGYLIANGQGKRKNKRPQIHGRWDYDTARDELYTCIINYMRL